MIWLSLLLVGLFVVDHRVGVWLDARLDTETLRAVNRDLRDRLRDLEVRR